MGYFDNYNADANTPFVIVGGSAGQIGLSKERYWAADDCAFFACHDIYKEYLYYVLLLTKVIFCSYDTYFLKMYYLCSMTKK